MKTYKIELVETISDVVEIKAKSIDDALSKIQDLNSNRNIELIVRNNTDIVTSMDFHILPQHEVNSGFSTFVYEKAKKSLDSLSLEELSKFTFGTIANAIINFNNEKR